MKRQQAFTNSSKKFLKGGLHCHTTRSDGKLTPEETLRYAASQGYDFQAITDHQIYNFRNDAPDTGVLVIPGMEYANDLEKGRGYRCFHTVCIGPEKKTATASIRTTDSLGVMSRIPKPTSPCWMRFMPKRI